MTDLLKLAERVEMATGPDRELDADIALTQGWHELPGDNWIGPHGQICVPAYTASLDAAMSLVPPYHTVTVGSCNESDCVPWACVTSPPEEFRDHVGEASTMALALCAAALRARAVSPDKGGDRG